MSIVLDTGEFDKAMRDIARLTGASFEDVVHNEAHAILKKSIKNTGAASVQNIQAHFDYKGEGQTPKSVIDRVTLNGVQVRVRSIRKYGAWKSLKKGNKFDKNRINPQFRELQKVLKARKAWAKARRGQSKATWVYIAKRLKLKPLTVPGYVMKAYALLPQYLKRKLRGKDVTEGKETFYTLIVNEGRTAMAPASNKGPGGYYAFKDAFRGRQVFFRINMDKGVFDRTSMIAKKYPGLEVVKS